ncbi:hypothetical protein JK358_00905 [Nocardia sp. 2]|uniref:Uncharacterized protein n=1 Tax=Nocardia acididurans TaxID=2802282 RepID=A0ABS1LX91_9NOCA|nr:hypothetical protein [Nocardia acididurans]MBL1072948.1 hypothetical protein [Nocardia acididurans]
MMIAMRGVSDSVGLPYTVNPLEIVDREALIEIREGPEGEIGPEGAAAWPWFWQGDITDPDALRSLMLTTADARKAWRVVSENAIYYWTGLEFIAFEAAFGRSGRQGSPNRFSGSGVAAPAGSTAIAELTGTAPAQHLMITIPRGETGPPGGPGEAGRIQDAADVLVDDAHPLGGDYLLAWDAAADRFVPRPSPRLGGPWTIGQGQFQGGANIRDRTKVVASLTIPGQPVAWRPHVTGDLKVSAANGNRCDVEVRLGGPAGELVAGGYGPNKNNWDWILIAPRFQHPLGPASTAGVVPANQTVTLYIIVQRTQGEAAYTVLPEEAQLIVEARAV